MVAPTVNVTLPGRLGDPSLELRSDLRSDPRMVAAFAPSGLVVTDPSLPVDRNSPVSELLAVAAAVEQNFGTVFLQSPELPGPDGAGERAAIRRPDAYVVRGNIVHCGIADAPILRQRFLAVVDRLTPVSSGNIFS
jgi:hypothetical protein